MVNSRTARWRRLRSGIRSRQAQRLAERTFIAAQAPRSGVRRWVVATAVSWVPVPYRRSRWWATTRARMSRQRRAEVPRGPRCMPTGNGSYRGSNRRDPSASRAHGRVALLRAPSTCHQHPGRMHAIVCPIMASGITSPDAMTGAEVSTSIRHAKAAMIRRPRERRQRCRDRSMDGTYPARHGSATLESSPCAVSTPNARSYKSTNCRRARCDHSPKLNADGIRRCISVPRTLAGELLTGTIRSHQARHVIGECMHVGGAEIACDALHHLVVAGADARAIVVDLQLFQHIRGVLAGKARERRPRRLRRRAGGIGMRPPAVDAVAALAGRHAFRGVAVVEHDGTT